MLILRGYASMVSTWRHVQKTLPVPCQKAMNERDAVGLALATGTVALLPGSAQAMWGLGASANAGISYLADGTVDPANAAIARLGECVQHG